MENTLTYQKLIGDAPLLLLFLLTIILMVVFIEIGFVLAQRNRGKPNKSQMAQVRAVMAASLGLLAFMLAFSFSTAQRHFESRIDAYLLEISAVDFAYRGADLLGIERQEAAKDLLREFMALRRETKIASDKNDSYLVIENIRKAGRIQDELWSIAESSMAEEGSVDAGIFVNAILAMIKANNERVQAKLFNRISPIVNITLLTMALLSMIIMGFQAGLTGTYSRLATWTLAITFSAVMVLVIDLDRPSMSLFKMNQQLMVDLQNRMNPT